MIIESNSLNVSHNFRGHLPDCDIVRIENPSSTFSSICLHGNYVKHLLNQIVSIVHFNLTCLDRKNKENERSLQVVARPYFEVHTSN